MEVGMINIIRRKKLAHDFLKLTFLIPALFYGCTNMSTQDTLLKNIDYIAKTLSTELVSELEHVEAFLGEKLEPNGTGPFSFWHAEDIELGEVQIENVDYRRPNPEQGATSGALLILDVDVEAHCIGRTKILETLPDIVLTDIPRGRSLDEEAYWTRETDEFKLSFGFAERNPDCLKSIIYNVKNPPAS